jgi:hypothetical protein
MATTSVVRALILLAGAQLAAGCGPRAVNEPPAQTIGTIPTPADAGLPASPSNRRGVIVPSDVQLEPPPREAQAPAVSPAGPAIPSRN